MNSTWWPEYDDIFLRDNWGKMPASKIGEALGRSKNSVLGRAHRLKLEHLISPPFSRLKPVIQTNRAAAKREYFRKRYAARKAGLPFTRKERLEVARPATTLPALEALKAIAEEPFKHEVEPMPKRPANPAPPPLRRQPLPPSTPRVVEKEPAIWANHSCCWPIGEPGTRDFKYCDEPVVFGQSYCSVHRKIAYQPKQRERVS